MFPYFQSSDGITFALKEGRLLKEDYFENETIIIYSLATISGHYSWMRRRDQRRYRGYDWNNWRNHKFDLGF